MERYEVIVIGVGGVGSATVHHLAKRGTDVLGLEQFDVPNEKGSSYGTRIIVPSGRHPALVALQQRAYTLWRDLEAAYGEQLLHVTGSLDIGLEGNYPFANEQRACQEHGLKHEVLTGTEVTERFPAYQIPDEYMAVFQSDGGFLDAERCNVAHVQTAQDCGAEIHAHETVLDWESLATGIRVRTDRGEYEAETLVVTSGAWVGNLVDELRELVTPAWHLTARFQPETPDQFAPETFPVFSMQVDGELCYGTPIHRRSGVKFGRGEALENPANPDIDQQPTDDDENKIRPFVAQYFPTGDGPTMRLNSGLITWTPDGNPILDTLPESADVVIGAGFSGSGFKMASVFGEMLSDIALDGESTHETNRFRLSRFD